MTPEKSPVRSSAPFPYEWKKGEAGGGGGRRRGEGAAEGGGDGDRRGGGREEGGGGNNDERNEGEIKSKEGWKKQGRK